MSNSARQLLFARRVESSCSSTIIYLGIARTIIRPQVRGHLRRNLIAAKSFHNSKQVSATAIENPNGAGIGIKAELSGPTPLSALPTSALLRSLLISTICTKPFLLKPSLAVLSFLSKPNRSFLFSIDRNPLLHWLVKRTLYDQFCTGVNGAEVKKTMNKIHQLGFVGVILTYAKETTFDHKSNTEQTTGTIERQANLSEQKCEHIEAWRKGTLDTVHMCSKGDKVALKVTGAGPVVTKAFAAGELPPPQMMDALHEICEAARRVKSSIVVDAESQYFQKGIARTAVELMRRYNTGDDTPLVYQTYQCYLKNTRKHLAKDLKKAAGEGWHWGVKLVRGAYMATDERARIHDTKEDTDNAYNSIARDLMRRDVTGFGGPAQLNGKPFPRLSLVLATHNQETALRAYELHRELATQDRSPVPLEFAQLQGMADNLSFALLQARDARGEAPRVSKCSTWGSMDECLAYLLRRAVENLEAVSRTRDEFTAVKAEFRRRVLAVFGF